MAVKMEDVLRKIGWDDGCRIPISNAENAALEEEIELLGQRRHKAFAANEISIMRYKALEKHMKHLKEENEENLKLISAHKEQLDSDEHLYTVRKNEREKLQQDVRKMIKKAEEIKQRQELKKGDLSRGLEKMEKMKSEACWDAEALQAWEESLKKRDEDNELLKNFTKEDQRRANELEAKRQNLQMEVVKRRDMVQKMCAELVNYEQVLERTGKMLKQLREEKNRLIKQWQETVHNLRQRDDATLRIHREIESAQEVLLCQKTALQEQNDFLLNEQRNNKEVEEKIEEMNQTNCKLRRELNNMIQYVLTLNNEVNTHKRTMLATAQTLEKERLKSKSLSQEINYKEMRIGQLEGDIDMLRKKLNEVLNTSMTSAERAKQLEDIISFEEKQTEVIATDSIKMQKTLFFSQQKLQELKDQAKTKEVEINNVQISMGMLRKHAKEVLVNLERKKEILYDLDYRKSRVESKLALLEGQVNDDEDYEELLSKISELDKVKSKAVEEKNMLQAQINRLSDEMRRLSNTLTADNKVLDGLRDKLQNQVLLYEGGLKQTTTAKQLSQQKQVEENLLRLRVDSLTKNLAKEDTNIYNLQKYRLELETAMKERSIEIEMNKDVLKARRRNLEEEIGRLRSDIMGRVLKIEHLEKRYYIAISLLGKDESGEPLSISHYKFKKAQEKFFLQQEGDELDKKIRTAEKEIIAMENTLKVLNLTNANYKASLAPVDEDDEEMEEMKQLQSHMRERQLALRSKKKSLEKQIDLNGSLKNKMSELEKEKDILLNVCKEEEQSLSLINKEHNDKLEKLERAQKHTEKAMKVLKKKNINVEKQEKDFLIRNLQSSNQQAFQKLREIYLESPEIGPKLDYYLSLHGLSFLESLQLRYDSDTLLTMATSSSSSKSKSDFGPYPQISQVTLCFEESKSSLKSDGGSKMSVSSKEKMRISTLERMKGATMSSMYRFTKVSSQITKESVTKGLSKMKQKTMHDSISGSSSKSKVATEDSMKVPSGLFVKTPEPSLEVSSLSGGSRTTKSDL